MSQHPIDRALDAAFVCARTICGHARPTHEAAARAYDFLEQGGCYAVAYRALCAGRRASRVDALRALSEMACALQSLPPRRFAALRGALSHQQRAIFAGDAELWT